MKEKICVILNMAPLYRESIYRLIDKEWDCEWSVGTNTTDIKEMPREALNSVSYVNIKQVGPLSWQCGIGHLIRKKRSKSFLMVGEPMCLSTWWILVQRRLFFRNKRVFLWTHGWYGRENFAKKWLKRFFFGMADHVFTYGEYARQQAALQGFDVTKITPIHNSLDHANHIKLRNTLCSSDVYKKHFSNDYPTLIFIGRLTAVKRLDLLFKAVSLLKQKGQNYNIVLIGTGSEQCYLEKLADELKLRNNIWFYGACYDDSKIAQLIYDADLCVAPGNVGLTAIHTMTFGTPVLTHSDIKWQMPEFEAIIPGKTGAFFNRECIVSLAEGVEAWIISHPDRKKVRLDCYKEIDEKWTPEFQLEVLKRKI